MGGVDEWLVKVSWLGKLASVFWQFVVPLYCGGSSLWVGLSRFPG